MLSAAHTQKLVQCIQRSAALSAARFSTAAEAVSADAGTDVEVTKLSNGVTVASCEQGGGVSKIGISVRAGSRFESGDSLGATHFLRNSAFSSNGLRSHISLTREMQILGGTLECSMGRELITRKAMALRSSLPDVIKNIGSALQAPLFNAWDLRPPRVEGGSGDQYYDHLLFSCGRSNMIVDAVSSDIASIDCTTKNIELLHKIAFRSGLGNSIYCSPNKANAMTRETLLAYTQQLQIAPRIAVVGMNCDHDELVALVDELELPAAEDIAVAPQQYYGGEAHLETSVGLTYATLVGPGAGVTSDAFPAFAVLESLLSDSIPVPGGSESTLTRMVGAATDAPFIVSPLNLSYSDTGLLGVHVVAKPADVSGVLTAARNACLEIAAGVSEEAVACAKAKLSLAVLGAEQDAQLDDMLNQVALTGGYQSPGEVAAKMDAVSVEDVRAAAQQCFGGKSTLAVTGDCTDAPYLDAL